jgi:adenylylsulfate kinase
MFFETSTRSLVKSISWRVLATLVTAFVVWMFTGRIALAVSVGSVEALAKMLLFYVHERAWDRIRIGRKQVRPAVVWFTGLSGAGKTTLARYVEAELTKRGWKCETLDGDVIRHIFPATGFGRADRHEHVCRVGYLASRLESQGIFAVAALISPYAESRAFVRDLCRNFLEIHLSTPLDACERRDPKGLYARARRGELQGLTGVDDPYEAPVAPELTIDTSATSVEEAGAQVMRLLVARSL